MNQENCTSLDEVFSKTAMALGGEVYELDLKMINPKQSIRLKCQVPLCEYYGVCRVCPPHIPGVEEFKQALTSYTRAFLVVYREKINKIEEYRENFTAELKLAEIVSALEFTAFQSGYYEALGLCVGGCKYCQECAPLSEPCRHPFKARSSPEGFGIDVTELARHAGVSVEWPPKDFVNFLGLVFV